VLTGCGASEVPPELEDTLDRARWQQRAAVGLYVVAGATAITGVALLYFNRPGARATGADTISVSGTIGPGSGLFTASVRF
jgi:hypothetical protein